MALVAEGRGVDQEQFAAFAVPKMESTVPRKPFSAQQASIVENSPESRSAGHHYITTDPLRVQTKGQAGRKKGRGQCSVCHRFWAFGRRVTTICGQCKVHQCADGCFLQWHQKEPDFGATY
jgi:mono/diheme cytochrome c family protein